MATVPQDLIDGLLQAFRDGDATAADSLWDLQEHMTPEQRADTETKVHAISDEQEVGGCPHCGVVTRHPAGNVQCPACGKWANYAHASDE